MKLAGKRSVWLEYLVIFLGTGLMATAIKALSGSHCDFVYALRGF